MYLFAVSTPRSVELHQDILLRVQGDLLEVFSYEHLVITACEN